MSKWSIRLFVCLAVVLLAVTTMTEVAFAAPPDADACLASYEQTQRLRKVSKLVEAEHHAVTCAAESCPAQLRGDCATWLEELRRALPSMVVSAKDKSGCDLVEARVTVDGQERANRIDGRALVLDPGEHVVRIETPGSPAQEQRLVLAEGEQSRRVNVSFAPQGAVCGKAAATGGDGAAPTTSQRSPLKWIVGGIGLTTLLVGAAVEMSGLSQEATLSECKPRCSPSDVDDMRTTFLVGDVLILTGAIGLGVATYLWLSSPSSPPAAASSASWPLRF